MRRTKAHQIVDILSDNGIEHVFGIPGTHNIEFYDALADHPKVKPILITDEQSAGFLGDGYARASGKMAALSLVPGAGLSHALSGIAEAYLDQIPLLVIACGIRRDSGKKYQLHDIDQIAMVKPVSKWTVSIRDWSKLEDVFTTAIRIAQEAPKGPVVVEVPAEGMLLSNPVSTEQGELFQSLSLQTTMKEGEREVLEELIKKSKCIGLYIGNIGHNLPEAQKTLLRLAEHLDAYVWSTITSKGLYPETAVDGRFVWNILGAGAPESYREIEKQVDLWIALGTRFGEVATASYGFTTSQPVVHVDVDRESLGANVEEALSLQMDAWNFINDIFKFIPPRKTQNSVQILNSARAQYEAKCNQQREVAGRISPRRLFKALQSVFPKDTVYAVDSGNGLFLGVENLKLEHPGCFLAPVDYSCMGYSIPASIGAKMSNPNRSVVALPGDGAFLMTGLELLTAKTYSASPLVLVLRDGELSQISQFQKGSVVRTTLTELPAYEVSQIAAVTGFQFKLLSANDNLENFFAQALNQTKNGIPMMVEVPIDYEIKTDFTKGVVLANFKRFPLNDKLSLIGRVLARKAAGIFESK